MSKPTFNQVLAAVVYATNNGIEIPFDISRLSVKSLKPDEPDPELAAILPESDNRTTWVTVDRNEWPKTQGPQDGPHPWSLAVLKAFEKRGENPNGTDIADDEKRDADISKRFHDFRNMLMFEAARGVLTYREMEETFGCYTAPYMNKLARDAGIARHQNPTIHKGKTSRSRNVS